MEIRGLSLQQPWASLMAFGVKKIETRSWSTNYRGLVAIHASSKMDPDSLLQCHANAVIAESLIHHGVNPTFPSAYLSMGVIVAVGELYDVRPMFTQTGDGDPLPGDWMDNLTAEELAFGYYASGRYGFLFRNVVALDKPIWCRGALNLWTLPEDVQAKLEAQIGYLEGEGLFQL